MPCLGSLQSHKTSSNSFFLVDEVLSFDLLGQCENRLRIGFRNELLAFTRLLGRSRHELHILKITFKMVWTSGMGIFLLVRQEFSARFPVRKFVKFGRKFGPKLARIWSEVGPKFGPKLARSLESLAQSLKLPPASWPEVWPRLARCLARSLARSLSKFCLARSLARSWPEVWPEVGPKLARSLARSLA